MVASGSSDNTVRLWDAVTGEEQATLTGHMASVTSVVFSSDGSMVASGSEDYKVQLWDVVTGEEESDAAGDIRGMSIVYRSVPMVARSLVGVRTTRFVYGTL